MITGPSIQIDSLPMAISVSGEVVEQTQFWDSGLLWDSGLFWDTVIEVQGAPSIQVT